MLKLTNRRMNRTLLSLYNRKCDHFMRLHRHASLRSKIRSLRPFVELSINHLVHHASKSACCQTRTPPQAPRAEPSSIPFYLQIPSRHFQSPNREANRNREATCQANRQASLQAKVGRNSCLHSAYFRKVVFEESKQRGCGCG